LTCRELFESTVLIDDIVDNKNESYVKSTATNSKSKGKEKGKGKRK